MFVFTSSANVQHVGFVQSFDRRTQTLKIVGGDQAERVKVTNMPYSVTNPLFRVTHVRRNWTVPAEYDVPLWELSSSPSTPTAFTPGAGRAGPITGIPRPTSTDTLIENARAAIDRASAPRPTARPRPQ
jgi:hypothetical protein